MSGGGFTLVDFSRPARDMPLTHPPAEPLLCKECQKKDLVYFDPNCDDCQNMLLSPETTIPQIFAVMRQWIPSIQQNMSSLAREVLRRGAHINDRDSLSDLTLLQYAVKSGADGIGSASQAANLAQMLLTKGAEVRTKCRWTDMNALHYAAFFNVAPAIATLLEAAPDLLNSRTSCFSGGTALHIGATNLCCEAVSLLVSRGADTSLSDDVGKLAVDCIPPGAEDDEQARALADKVRTLLQNPPTTPTAPPSLSLPVMQSGITEESDSSTSAQGEGPSLEEVGLKLGDAVIVGPQSSNPKNGVLRFYGNIKSEEGLWAGVELDEPVGKHNGSVNGVQYFKCQSKHGVFAPLSKLAKTASTPQSPTVRQRREERRSGVGRLYSPSPLVNTQALSPSLTSKNFKVGDRVLVGGQKVGTVQFSGPTKFASGWWFGIELDEAKGKNNGSVNGVRYFTCADDRGIFAPPHRLSKWRDEDNITDGVGVMPTTPTDSVGSRTPNSAQRKLSDRTPTTSSSAKKALFSKATSSSALTATRVGEELILKEGMNVYVHGKMATVRYIGSTEFADGTWLGVEFRTPDGRHDGTVKGRTYFTCKPSHGLLIKPSKATFRGLSCSQLIKN